MRTALSPRPTILFICCLSFTHFYQFDRVYILFIVIGKTMLNNNGALFTGKCITFNGILSH